MDICIAARRRRRVPAEARLEGDPEGRPAPSGSRLRRPGLGAQRPSGAGAAQPAAALRQRPTRRNRLRVDPARRPGHRALGGRVVRAEPEVLRSRRTSSSSRSKAAATRVATTFGVLGSMSRKYAHRIPFIVKMNHNELMTLPNKFDQIMFGSVEQAYDLGAAGVGATIYFGSDESTRQIQEVAAAFGRGAPARNVHRAVVLPAQRRLQAGRHRLPRRRRPHRRRPTTSA